MATAFASKAVVVKGFHGEELLHLNCFSSRFNHRNDFDVRRLYSSEGVASTPPRMRSSHTKELFQQQLGHLAALALEAKAGKAPFHPKAWRFDLALAYTPLFQTRTEQGLTMDHPQLT